MVVIPNKIHFVWIGKPIPQKYADNIVRWAKLNPNYETYLWTQTEHITATARTILASYAEHTPDYADEIMEIDKEDTGVVATAKGGATHDFALHVHTISVIPPLLEPALLVEEMTAWKNYGLASDILRLQLLHYSGGIYMDVDIFPTGKSLPLDIQAPFGILLGSREHAGQTKVVNALIACPAQSPILVGLSKHLEASYHGEYEKIREGVLQIAPDNMRRMRHIAMVREIIATPDKHKEVDVADAKTYFFNKFVLATVGRMKGSLEPQLLPGQYDQKEQLSFQHQTNYFLTIGDDHSWHI